MAEPASGKYIPIEPKIHVKLNGIGGTFVNVGTFVRQYGGEGCDGLTMYDKDKHPDVQKSDVFYFVKNSVTDDELKRPFPASMVEELNC